MRQVEFGTMGPVSRLTLGGGGVGMVWGPTSRGEASATIRAAVDAGITLIDTAPMYGACEAIIGETFAGAPPAGLRFTSKCALGSPPATEIAEKISASVDASLEAMRLEAIDLFFLHTNICADDFRFSHGDGRRAEFATMWTLYRDEVIPAFERLRASGRIKAWGITGIGVPETILEALAHTPKPHAVQAIANLMDSAGALRRFDGPARPRSVIAAAVAAGVGVMGIRAVQAGALTSAMDREVSPNSPDRADFDRAAPFRALASNWGQDPALIAHRYALSIAGVDTVVLGVKNRAELAQALAAETAGPFSPGEAAEIDRLGLRAA